MADILEGVSDHMHFAPLSTEQTRAICKHLQAQIDDLHSTSDSLDKEKDLANGLHNNLVQDVDQERMRANELKRALDATQLELDGAKKEIQQAKVNAQRLRSDLENTNNNLGELRDSQHRTDQLAQGTADGLERTNKTLKQVRDQVEGKVMSDVDKLREELRKNEYDTNVLKNTCDQLKTDAKAQLESLRGAHAMARGVADNLAKTDSSVDQLTQKTNDLGKSLVTTQKTMDGTRNGLLKLQDNQMRTASAVGDVQGGIRRLSDDARVHKDHLQDAARNLGSNQDELLQTKGDLGFAKEALARQEAMIGKLRSNLEHLAGKNDQMAAQLEQTDMIARGAKKGLDQTNAVVLPNLALDPHVASSHEFARTRTPRMTPKAAGTRDSRSRGLDKSGGL
mmetsp:Transcript_115097/g.229219  ORF Transcript_115097/g.229219 Transcript_115097/m.229219 type:complete len:395 (+) Transcript_115097:67-1251(+)|eukprot:CAMPEP_0172694442 /NCGR_PEP_ID=MMETSP1074-20121228/26670_1 /TAXON_ID=2916 /ORGANISM="Ceratium fusus, Strain PA161109" /LENGTH=394 /DNA_ID=CAMNT_0013514941 /DNA_START=56 /DNA_END=1240 /DNA_ORIENTATION=-